MTTLQLSDYSLMLRKHGREQVIAYASIISIRISKSSGKNFKMFLSQDGHPPVVIPNYSFSEKGDSLDQSGAYSLFVRVLHHYLKDKSRTVFTSGGDASRIWQWAVILATFSLIISLAADYVGFSLINPYVQAMILTGLTIVIVVALGPGKLPKTYMPTDIPLQFLP